MNPAQDESTAEDPRLLQAVQEYLAEIEAGRRPDRRTFAARFPDLTEAMVPYLDALDVVHAATPQLQESRAGRSAPAGVLDMAEPLGDFRIVREIGRGGMGVVYEATQLSLGRKVALKVLSFAAALDSRQLQRFKNEAQAAAYLHHTNIVPVYAVGTDRGVHYYAMQLIEGENLAVVIEALRHETPQRGGETQVPRPLNSTGPYVPASRGTDFQSVRQESGRVENPSYGTEGRTIDTRSVMGAQFSTQRSARPRHFFRTVARLVVQVAEGLEYAHGLGIVHRDIKPANLLVDAQGNVWITDFGLAQFHTDAGLTQTGDLLGTLRYMSPEQAGGQRVLLDHHTDIYSLGATLYELLTLRPIFEGQDRQALLRQILNQEPRPPRTIDRSIPPELETIVLKAIGKAPGDRYASARDFADDLNHFLRDEPIQARRPTLTQRTRKWLRRHPSVPVAAAVLLVLLAAGSLVSASFIRGAYKRERNRADEAEQQFQLARSAVDEMIQLADQELAEKPDMQGLRKQLLESALVYYQKFIAQRGDDPEAQAELAATKERIKEILKGLALLQGGNPFDLLREKSVLDDLHASAEQRHRVTEASARHDARQRETFRDFHRLTPKEREQRGVELARANEADVTALLDAQQFARLGQIILQRQGPAAFRRTDVAAALKLTTDQKTRIQTIESEAMRGPLGGHGHGDWRKPHEEKMKGASERILAVLTEEQKKQWRDMTGEPFKGALAGEAFKGPMPFQPRLFTMGNFWAKPLLEALDADRDGKVTKEEFLTGVRRVFKESDRDDKGKIKEQALADRLNHLIPQQLGFGPIGSGGRSDERREGRPGERGGRGPFGGSRSSWGAMLSAAIFKRADRDKDGLLTLDELVTAAAALFEEADKDRNGSLDEREIADAIGLLLPPFPGFGQPGRRPDEPKKDARKEKKNS